MMTVDKYQNAPYINSATLQKHIGRLVIVGAEVVSNNSGVVMVKLSDGMVVSAQTDSLTQRLNPSQKHILVVQVNADKSLNVVDATVTNPEFDLSKFDEMIRITSSHSYASFF